MKTVPPVLKTMTFAALAALSALGWTSTALGQTFSSGSTGADGAYAPACAPTPCTVTETLNATGVYNYTTVMIPAGVTVRWTRNAANTPVTILATGDVNVGGSINISGNDGLGTITSGTTVRPGALGGPGGFNGGNGGLRGGSAATAGQGPGGGGPSISVFTLYSQGGSYGAPTNFDALLPLFGGSGGGGGQADADTGSGASGAGGGGALVIASSTKITVTGSILANGGSTSVPGAFCNLKVGNGGSGGAIRLVSREITGSGSAQANAGAAPSANCNAQPGSGRIRLEAFALGFAGAISPVASQVIAPGPVTPASTPALAALPAIAVAAVAGTASPAVPGGLFAVADVSLPAGTTNPVTVTVAATNTPVGSLTALTLRLVPQSGPATTIAIPAASQSGSFASSSATTSVTLPVGQVSVLQAWATMTLTGQIASLFPLIDGEPVESVAMASPLDDGKPAFTLVTKSGKEKRFDELSTADRAKVIVAWQALAANR